MPQLVSTYVLIHLEVTIAYLHVLLHNYGILHLMHDCRRYGLY